MLACKFTMFSESRLWECRVLLCFLRAVCGNVLFLRFCMQIYCVFCEPFMGMSCFTVFSESRLWECRVFTLFPYRQVRFDCIFTGFADNHLWEYRMFSFKKACLAQTSRVFLWIFHLFLFPKALQGFARLCEVLEGFAKFCKALGGFVGRS